MNKIQRAITIILALIMGMAFSFSSFADFTDNLALYTASASNAVMSVSADADSGIMPMSSVGTVTNTVKAKQIRVHFDIADSNGSWYKTVNTLA